MRYTTAVTLLALAGCASPPKTWTKDGSTEQVFNMETAQCRAQAYSIPGGPPHQQVMVFEACMQGKGWRPE